MGTGTDKLAVRRGGLPAQTPAAPSEGAFTHSLGLPQHWKWHGGLGIRHIL
jgi:hypothetical protein